MTFLLAVWLAFFADLHEVDAPKVMFPGATGTTHQTATLTDDELATLGKVLGRKVDLRAYPYYDVVKDGAPLGRIFILDVLGQNLPITFAVGVTPDLGLADIEVLAYREPHGEEIREPKFRRQFVGKKLAKDAIALDKDVSAISGATISSRSAIYAARKALGLAEILARRH